MSAGNGKMYTGWSSLYYINSVGGYREWEMNNISKRPNNRDSPSKNEAGTQDSITNLGSKIYEALDNQDKCLAINRRKEKSAAVHLQRHCSSNKSERLYADWIWWIIQGLPFQHLVRVVDCFLHEGIKVFYRTAMAILVLFHKSSSSSSSEWLAEIQKNGIESALNKFCKEMPVAPQKVLKVAFGIRGLSSSYISRVFLRTEMLLKSEGVINGSKKLVRSRSSENLPNSQSQNNIQMVSHTLTIREMATKI
ncbi:hypothetical protein NQ317_007967 [Molorchus minor]|uniref:Uncharacterized protein n=1 Tax=Molorchus minor TaxID=1323400 RepID=A0ABQ9JI46_9CUCU|nr:hypothetical protein NQ317_007967 [Molorchus minor]